MLWPWIYLIHNTATKAVIFESKLATSPNTQSTAEKQISN